VLDLAEEVEAAEAEPAPAEVVALEEVDAASAVTAEPEPDVEPAAVPAPPPTSAAEALAEISGNHEEVEIPQIDALDDIDSILDQLEDKG
jgi:hypothetical protein